MATITIDVPDELEHRVRSAGVDIESLLSREMQRAVLEDLAARSELTEEDALELGRSIREGMRKSLEKEDAA